MTGRSVPVYKRRGHLHKAIIILPRRIDRLLLAVRLHGKEGQTRTHSEYIGRCTDEQWMLRIHLRQSFAALSGGQDKF